MMLKVQKVKLVQKLREEMKGYSLVGVLSISSMPDRLLQKTRNSLKPNAKVVVARKSLLKRALDGSKELERLDPYIDANVALILAKGDPFELSRSISSNMIKLGAKPGQISPSDISIEAGETAIPPGPAVTTLKAAGIDTQIQKGKVVIAKDKVLVKKGTKISTAVSRALKMLEITPFEAIARLSAVSDGRLVYTADILEMTPQSLSEQLSKAFSESYALTIETGYVTGYNIPIFLRNAYFSAFGLGLATKTYEPGIVEHLLAEAMVQAVALNANVKVEQAEKKEEKEEQKKEEKEEENKEEKKKDDGA